MTPTIDRALEAVDALGQEFRRSARGFFLCLASGKVARYPIDRAETCAADSPHARRLFPTGDLDHSFSHIGSGHHRLDNDLFTRGFFADTYELSKFGEGPPADIALNGNLWA